MRAYTVEWDYGARHCPESATVAVLADAGAAVRVVYGADLSPYDGVYAARVVEWDALTGRPADTLARFERVAGRCGGLVVESWAERF